MASTDPDSQRGIDSEYRVEKVNSEPLGRVFVLDYDNDRHARVALAAYADSCESDFPQMAADLRRNLTEPPESASYAVHMEYLQGGYPY